MERDGEHVLLTIRIEMQDATGATPRPVADRVIWSACSYYDDWESVAVALADALDAVEKAMGLQA